MTADDVNFQEFHRFLVDHLYVEGIERIPLNKARKVFEDPRVRPYLSELVKSVCKKNVLIPSEISAYKELERLGKVEHDIDISELIAKRKLKNKDLEEEIAALDRNIAVAQEERNILVEELDNAENMRNNCMEKQGKLHSWIVKTKHEMQDSRCKTHERYEQVERTVMSLSKHFSELCTIIQNVHESNNLFAHANLDDLMKTQGNFETSLTGFVKAYLHEVSHAFLVDLQNINLAHTEGSLHNGSIVLTAEDQKPSLGAALARAQHWFPNREKQSIESKVREASAASMISFYSEKLNQFQVFMKNYTPTRQTLESTSAKIQELKNKIDVLRQEEIPTLVSELADLFKSYMLVGDYHAKSQYQLYVTEKQKKVLSLLHHQQAILDIALIILTGEKAGHEETAQKIHSLYNLVHGMVKGKIPESEWLDQHKETTAPMKRTLFSGNDHVPLTAASHLSGADYDGSFLNFDDLPLLAENLAKMQKNMENSVIANERQVKEMSDQLTKCWENVKPTASSDNAIDLTQKNLTTWISTLEKHLRELSSAVLANCDEIDRKNRLLKHDHDAMIKRSEWLEFISKSQRDNR